MKNKKVLSGVCCMTILSTGYQNQQMLSAENILMIVRIFKK